MEEKVKLRISNPSVKKEMVTHKGECKYCSGIVKMPRHPETLKLEPDKCWCLLCGQHYFVEVGYSIDNWELEQWRQKRDE